MRLSIIFLLLGCLIACSDTEQEDEIIQPKNDSNQASADQQHDTPNSSSDSQSVSDNLPTNKPQAERDSISIESSASSTETVPSNSAESYRPKTITFNKSQPQKTRLSSSYSLQLIQKSAANNDIKHRKLPDLSKYNFGQQRWLGKEPSCYDQSDLRLQTIVGVYIRNTEMDLERTYGSEVFYFDSMTDERLNLFQHEQVRKRDNDEEGESKIFDCKFVGDDHFAYAAVSGNYLIVYNLNNGQRIGSYHFKEGLDDATISSTNANGRTTINVLTEDATYRFQLNG